MKNVYKGGKIPKQNDFFDAYQPKPQGSWRKEKDVSKYIKESDLSL